MQLGERGDFSGEGCRISNGAVDAKGLERFFHGCEAFRRDDVGARDEKMGRGVDLVALEGVVPEAALPALTVDNRELEWPGEAFEIFVEGNGLEELLGVGGAVGLDEEDAVGFVLEVAAGENKKLEYEVIVQQGTNAKQNNVTLEAGKK